MTNTQLAQLLANQPREIQDEIIRINTEARPIALQVALLIPLLAGLIGLFNSFRMMRLPDPDTVQRRRDDLGIAFVLAIESWLVLCVPALRMIPGRTASHAST